LTDAADLVPGCIEVWVPLGMSGAERRSFMRLAAHDEQDSKHRRLGAMCVPMLLCRMPGTWSAEISRSLHNSTSIQAQDHRNVTFKRAITFLHLQIDSLSISHKNFPTQ
jgi:hypothetical protein